MATINPAAADLDGRAMAVFRTAVQELLGGPLALADRQELSVLPALMESAWVLVLHEEAGLDPSAIAKRLGTSVGTVQSVYDAPMETALARVHYNHGSAAESEPHSDPDWSGAPAAGRLEPAFHAGALAKFAYDVVKRRTGYPTPVRR